MQASHVEAEETLKQQVRELRLAVQDKQQTLGTEVDQLQQVRPTRTATMVYPLLFECLNCAASAARFPTNTAVGQRSCPRLPS